MWQLMWRNVRALALNAMLQFLVIYRFPKNYKFKNEELVLLWMAEDF